jgi:hypothetical protein
VWEQIEHLELDPLEFRWSERVDRWDKVDSLEHDATGSYFLIGVGGDGTFYFIEYDPGTTAQVSKEGGLSWPDTLIHLRLWLKAVAEEADEPDKWETTDEAREQLTSMLDATVGLDAPLSTLERERIVEHLSWVREEVVVHHDLTPGAVAMLDARLEEIESAASRLTKKDFLNYAIGAMVTLAVELALSAEIRSALLRATIAIVSNTFEGFRELSPPPLP